MNREVALNQCRITFFGESPGRVKIGQPLLAKVEVKIVSTIKVRSITATFRGFERVCWKKVSSEANLSSSNCFHRDIIKDKLLVLHDDDNEQSLRPGIHSYDVKFTVRQDLPSSFALSEHNPFTGVFYTLQAELETSTRLKSGPVPVEVEGRINTRPLELDAKVNRKSAKSLFLGGNMHLRTSLQRSVLVAGDTVRVDVELTNNSTSKPDYVLVALKQELKLVTNEKKKVTHVSERVHTEKVVETIPPNDTWHKTVEFRIPQKLPTTQTTPKGVITIEYHINVRIHLPFASDMRCRLPLLILQRTQFPDLQTPSDVERRRSAVATGEATNAARQLELANVAASSTSPTLSARNAQAKSSSSSSTAGGAAPPTDDNRVYSPAPATSNEWRIRVTSGGGNGDGRRAVSAALTTTNDDASMSPSAVARRESASMREQSAASSSSMSSLLTPPSSSTSTSGGARSPKPAPRHDPKTDSTRYPPPSPTPNNDYISIRYDDVPGAAPPKDLYGHNTATQYGSMPRESDEEMTAEQFGYHSPDAVKKYRLAVAHFDSFDKDHSGTIDKQEFVALHADLVAAKLTTKSVQDSWDELDADGDGQITFSEYVDWSIRVGLLPPPQSPPTSRRGSFLYHVEEYPFTLSAEERHIFSPEESRH